MLTPAAMHVLNSDPYFTCLQAGAFAAVKPSGGTPCDGAFPCHSHGLSKGAKVVLGLSVLGVVIVAGAWYYYKLNHSKSRRITYEESVFCLTNVSIQPPKLSTPLGHSAPPLNPLKTNLRLWGPDHSASRMP